jgi:hypothetical protein
VRKRRGEDIETKNNKNHLWCVIWFDYRCGCIVCVCIREREKEKREKGEKKDGGKRMRGGRV